MNETTSISKPKPKAKKLALVAIVVGILLVLALILSPRIAAAKARAHRINCVCHEKQLGIAFRGFGVDMGGFPMQISNTNAPANNPTPP